MAVLDDTKEFIPSQQMATLRVHDTTMLDPGSLGTWFATKPAREQIRRLSWGTAIQRVAINDLASLTVRLLPLIDQREIGRRLLAFDYAIKAHRVVTACLQELRDLDLVVAFTGTVCAKSAAHAAPSK
jgi:hypothetical protein